MQHKIYNSIKIKKKALNNNTVVNLSRIKLTLSQIYVLNKGLNFCRNETNKSKLIRNTTNEISQFIRNIQIKYMFLGADNKIREPFTGNKQWKPPKNKQHQAIVALEDILKEEFKYLVKNNNNRNNVSSTDRHALKSLRNNQNIIIKKADKGGCIVILDTNTYLQKIDVMLSDSTTYSQLNQIDLNQKKLEADIIINKLFENNSRSKRQKKYLTNFSPEMPVFMAYPKFIKKTFHLDLSCLK